VGRLEMKTDGQERIRELIVKVKARDDVAFADLLTEYTPMLSKLISGFSGPFVSYDEAFSEASVALYRAALSYDFKKNAVTFGLYAKICVYRRLCDLYEKSSKNVNVNTVELDVDKIAVYANIESKIVALERMREYLLRAKEILSSYEYSVLLLYVEGYDTADIAKKLSKDKKSVENAKSRMLRALREDERFFRDV
jgi:RNA polymerase sporulation-specific sigma factor